MPIFSSLRYRNTAQASLEASEQLITFCLQSEWFALPINTIEKVIILPSIHGDPNNTGISITNYEGRELLVLDVSLRLFGKSTTSVRQENNLKTHSFKNQRYLIIVKTKTEELVGIPINSSPVIRRVPKSAFIPLPDIYLKQGNIQCLSSTMLQLADEAPIFIIEAEQLLRPEAILAQT